MKIRKTKKELNKLFNLEYRAWHTAAVGKLLCFAPSGYLINIFPHGKKYHIFAEIHSRDPIYKVIDKFSDCVYEIKTHDLYYGMLMTEKWNQELRNKYNYVYEEKINKECLFCNNLKKRYTDRECFWMHKFILGNNKPKIKKER